MELECVLQEAREKKEAGNNAYKSKDYHKAMKYYHHAILKTKALLGPQSASGVFLPEVKNGNDALTDHQRSETLALEADCYNNLAACLLQKESPDLGKVITYCDKALSQNPHNVKALFRKGQAHYRQKNYGEALAVFQGMEADSTVKKYIQLCQKEIGQEDQRLKETYQKMFAS